MPDHVLASTLCSRLTRTPGWWTSTASSTAAWYDPTLPSLPWAESLLSLCVFFSSLKASCPDLVHALCPLRPRVNRSGLQVGGKSRGLAALRQANPEGVGIPSSVAIPYGSFERALEQNHDLKHRWHAARAVFRILPPSRSLLEIHGFTLLTPNPFIRRIDLGNSGTGRRSKPLQRRPNRAQSLLNSLRLSGRSSLASMSRKVRSERRRGGAFLKSREWMGVGRHVFHDV